MYIFGPSAKIARLLHEVVRSSTYGEARWARPKEPLGARPLASAPSKPYADAVQGTATSGPNFFGVLLHHVMETRPV